VILARTWSNHDTINFHIPAGFRITRYTGFERDRDDDRYALQYGPLLMSLVGGNRLKVPPQHLIEGLSPVSGHPLQFSIAGHPSLKYMPYLQISDETFTSFPPVG
jgi:uncharacterized protein